MNKYCKETNQVHISSRESRGQQAQANRSSSKNHKRLLANVYIYHINYNLTEQCTAVVKHQMEGGEK